MLHVADGFSESDCGARDGENGGTIRRDRSGGVGCERTGANRRDVSDRIYECRRRRRVFEEREGQERDGASAKCNERCE